MAATVVMVWPRPWSWYGRDRGHSMAATVVTIWPRPLLVRTCNLTRLDSLHFVVSCCKVGASDLGLRLKSESLIFLASGFEKGYYF
jgi:hypothetical protein